MRTHNMFMDLHIINPCKLLLFALWILTFQFRRSSLLPFPSSFYFHFFHNHIACITELYFKVMNYSHKFLIHIFNHFQVNISNTWTLPQAGFNVFYRYFRDKISWFEADAVCQFHHANLVTGRNFNQAS